MHLVSSLPSLFGINLNISHRFGKIYQRQRILFLIPRGAARLYRMNIASPKLKKRYSAFCFGYAAKDFRLPANARPHQQGTFRQMKTGDQPVMIKNGLPGYNKSPYTLQTPDRQPLLRADLPKFGSWSSHRDDAAASARVSLIPVGVCCEAKYARCDMMV
jgi:hypothetical protein